MYSASICNQQSEIINDLDLLLSKQFRIFDGGDVESPT